MSPRERPDGRHPWTSIAARFGASWSPPLRLGLAGKAGAQSDPLPSWNAGPAKNAILKFVRATTDPASPDFKPPPERIATFDQDGTLWVEHPIYTQVVFCLDRVPAVVKEKPELADVEPFKTVLSGDREAIARLPTDSLVKIAAATLTGMDVDIFQTRSRAGSLRRGIRGGTASTPTLPTCRRSNS